VAEPRLSQISSGCILRVIGHFCSISISPMFRCLCWGQLLSKHPRSVVAAPSSISSSSCSVSILASSGSRRLETCRPTTRSTPPPRPAFLDILGVFAEFETNLRRERKIESIARPKANGVYAGKGGPPRSDSSASLATSGGRPFDSSLFAVQFRIVRSTSADGRARNPHVLFSRTTRSPRRIPAGLPRPLSNSNVGMPVRS
jgi:hypothetical protein